VTINVPNPEVLKAAFAEMEANLAYWYQGVWYSEPGQLGFDLPQENTCGTTACLAGFIVLASGSTWEQMIGLWVPDEALERLGFTKVLVPHDCSDESCMVLEWTDDAAEFREIFYKTSTWDMPNVDQVEGPARDSLGFTRDRFEYFKAYVSEQTGIEL